MPTWPMFLAVGLLLSAGTARADLPGRFFFTPLERAELSAQRSQRVEPGVVGGSLTVNGLVVRSSGKSTVWINNLAQHEHDSTSGVAVTDKQPAGGRVTVRAAGSSKPVSMRVGQTLETGSGQLREVYDIKPRQE